MTRHVADRRRGADPRSAGGRVIAVQVTLPRAALAIVRRRMRASETDTFEAMVVRSALWRMRGAQMEDGESRDEVVRMLRQAMRSGRGRVVTPQFWREMHERVTAHVKRVRAAEARGELANWTLPRELLEFVTSGMLSGRHETPTAVVCAALRLCEAEHRAHEKARDEAVRLQEERLRTATRAASSGRGRTAERERETRHERRARNKRRPG